MTDPLAKCHDKIERICSDSRFGPANWFLNADGSHAALEQRVPQMLAMLVKHQDDEETETLYHNVIVKVIASTSESKKSLSRYIVGKGDLSSALYPMQDAAGAEELMPFVYGSKKASTIVMKHLLDSDTWLSQFFKNDPDSVGVLYDMLVDQAKHSRLNGLVGLFAQKGKEHRYLLEFAISVLTLEVTNSPALQGMLDEVRKCQKGYLKEIERLERNRYVSSTDEEETVELKQKVDEQLNTIKVLRAELAVMELDHDTKQAELAVMEADRDAKQTEVQELRAELESTVQANSKKLQSAKNACETKQKLIRTLQKKLADMGAKSLSEDDTPIRPQPVAKGKQAGAAKAAAKPKAAAKAAPLPKGNALVVNDCLAALGQKRAFDDFGGPLAGGGAAPVAKKGAAKAKVDEDARAAVEVIGNNPMVMAALRKMFQKKDDGPNDRDADHTLAYDD